MAGGTKQVGKDEVREFPKGKLEIAKIGGAIVGRATFQPGWKWSESVKPIAGTDSSMSLRRRPARAAPMVRPIKSTSTALPATM